MQEIEEAEADFRKAVDPLGGTQIDVCFFPVDPRQGAMFDAGANYFLLSVKPRLMIPMHYFHRADVAAEFARTASCRTTEVLAMPGYGDRIDLTFDEEGYANVSFLPPLGAAREALAEAKAAAESALTGDGAEDGGEEALLENNPFLDSDLPVSLPDPETPEALPEKGSE